MKALERFPRNTSAYEDLAWALWKLSRSEEALAAAEEGIEFLPGRLGIHLVRGRNLESFGRTQEAARSYCGELDLRLEDVEAHEVLGGLIESRPELASLPEAKAVGEAIERRRSASGACEPFLLDSLERIRRLREETSGAKASPAR